MTVPTPPHAATLSIQANESNPLAHTPARSGWYVDPWRQAPWRWWDGLHWTGYTSVGGFDRGPRSGLPVEAGLPQPAQLPATAATTTTTATTTNQVSTIRPRMFAWLSWPIVVSAIVVVPSIVYIGIKSPLSILLGMVPLAIVLPILAWLDRIEPESRTARVHALLWGATVAPFVAVIVNTYVEKRASSNVAAVVSAPIIEETMKGLGVVWAVRRKEVDNVIDGIVFAGWVALGFAVAEDFTYFVRADASGQLFSLFIIRALLTPFSHPLFTAWTGLALGRSVAKGQPMKSGFWGLIIAMALHAGWNGSAALTQKTGNITILLVGFAFYIALFGCALVMSAKARRKERDRFLAAVPALTQRLAMRAEEAQVFGSWKTLRSIRASVPRKHRRTFDALHASLARLALLQQRDVDLQSVDAQRHIQTLQLARRTLGAER